MASQGGKGVCSQRWFFISLVLVIAIGGMTLFVCTAVISSSQKDVSLYKRAALYIKDNVQSTLQSSIKSIKNTFQRKERSIIVNKEFPYKKIRLPKDVLPSTYNLYLKPDLSSTFDFDGKVNIDITCVKPTKYVILHKKKLNITDYKIMDSMKKEIKVLQMLQNEENEQFLLETQDNLEAGQTYTVKLTFTGNLSNKMAGFYRSSYKTKRGETRYLATTQFESTDARAAFPCFDEPEFKAVFHIAIAHKKNLRAISNMPIEKRVKVADDFVESYFKPSVKMSTYLVAFIVSDFGFTTTKTKKGTTVRVWASRDNLKHTKFSLRVAKSVLSYYEKFFHISYPLPKIDLVAVPDFAAGAMENWGLMTFRENYLLSNEASASAADRQDVALVVSHELAHQWFGNLVTMKWWNDLWLNEGFANYVEYIGTDHYAKAWKVLDQFVTDTHQTALQVDSMQETHPISVPVTHPREITEIFDAISYNKGSSVIRMLRGFLGDKPFQKGLTIYLNKHRYGNAEADDLWAALSTVAEGLDVKAIMDTWIKQEGYPVINIKDTYQQKRGGPATKTATQNRFFRDINPSDKRYNDKAKDFKWIVPLSYVTGDAPDNPITIWMNKSSAPLHVSSGGQWIKANVGQMGYYRVNYDQENWKKLVNQLNDDHLVLQQTDRSGLLDDSFNLARGGYLDLKTALELTSYLDKERDYIPWSTALSNLGFIGSQLSMKPAFLHYNKYIKAKVKPLEEYVGWQDKGDILQKYLRSHVLSSLASHGDKSTVDTCVELFKKWMEDDEFNIEAHIRSFVYHTGIKYGGQKEWEFLWNKYEKSIDSTEKSRMLYALSGTREVPLQARYLQYTLDDSKLRTQDITAALSYMSGHPYGRLMVWDHFRKNFDKIYERIGNDPMELGYMISATTRAFNDDFHLKQVLAFVEEHKKVLGSLRATRKAIEQIKSNMAWVTANEKAVTEWLEGKVKAIKE